MRRCIIAFCKTNLALLDGTGRLFNEATALARSSPEDVTVRVIRCLTKCHSCGQILYVKVGDTILTEPTIGQLHDAVAAWSKLATGSEGPDATASLFQPDDAERPSTQGNSWQP